MTILQGQGVSKGIEHGPLYFYQRVQLSAVSRTAQDKETELARLEQAKEQTMAQLEQMAETARAQAGDEAAVLFETHAMFVEDEDYTSVMEEVLDAGGSAEYAVEQAGEQFSAMLAEMDDPYMRARAANSPPTGTAGRPMWWATPARWSWTPMRRRRPPSTPATASSRRPES